MIQYDAVELALTDSQGAATETVRLNWQRKPLVAEKGVTAELPVVPVEPKVRDTFLTAIGLEAQQDAVKQFVASRGGKIAAPLSDDERDQKAGGYVEVENRQADQKVEAPPTDQGPRALRNDRGYAGGGETGPAVPQCRFLDAVAR